MLECDTCGDEFYDADDLVEHLNDYDHWIECETCTRCFRTQRACNQHMRDTDHWAPRYECETCPKDFKSWNAARQHMNSLGHWAPKFPCETCDLKFHTQDAAGQHMTKNLHYKTYCPTCDRHFQNENNLKMHLRSKTHCGNSINCPFCQSGFTTASGVVHHLETGSCRSAPQLNRETIHRLVRERDPNSLITTKQIEWHDEDNATCSATEKAWNGAYWECYLCHKQFNTIAGLNAHVNSPVHKQKIYHCPNSNGGCYKTFVVLAGLFSHLESESCGYTRFKNVQKQLQDVLIGQKAIDFR
ncbi:uncharacterized protein BDW47DRAFT_132590, partial [Aspergillus candidus]